MDTARAAKRTKGVETRVSCIQKNEALHACG